MKDGLLDDLALLEVLHHDSLQQCRRHPSVPDPFGIHHQDRSPFADAEAGGFAPFHAGGAKEEPFALEELGKEGVERAPFTVGGAIPARAYENVTGIRFHGSREGCHIVEERYTPDFL